MAPDSIGWLLTVAGAYGLAAAVIIVALLVFMPPLVRDLASWSRETFGRRRSNVVSLEERRRTSVRRAMGER